MVTNDSKEKGAQTDVSVESTIRDEKHEEPIASHPNAKRQRAWVPYVVEGIGTFGLVFAGCGAIMVDTLSGGQVTHVGVSLVFGLIITVMIYTFGHISGAHFNPAVTLALVVARHFPMRRGVSDCCWETSRLEEQRSRMGWVVYGNPLGLKRSSHFFDDCHHGNGN
jgi:hypothetical protein